jgi:MFS transporter, MHS family, proline/betaine transporter
MSMVLQQRAAKRARGAAAAAVVGNWLEFFDFTVYGFFAVVIAKLFFPSHDATVSLMLSVAVFAVGFITRPLGSVLLGVYADRHGRKAALSITITLMALSTGVIALCPTYEQIGIAAPVLIVAARLVQGFSQGGEFGAATSTLLEQGDQRNRAFRASWQLATQGGAGLTGAAAASLVSGLLAPDALESWGWRIPFAFGMLIAPVGIYLRRQLPDAEVNGSHGLDRRILKAVFTEHLRTMVLVTMMVMGGTVASYTLSYYMPTYAIHSLHLPMSTSMLIGVTAGLASLIGCPLFGMLSDRMRSRKKLIIVGRTLLMLSVIPVFMLIDRYPSIPLIVAADGVMLLVFSMGSAPQYAMMCELFPRSVRATGISISYAISVSLFGGTAQLVDTWLIRATGSQLAPAIYVAVCLGISIVAACLLRDTGKDDVE